MKCPKCHEGLMVEVKQFCEVIGEGASKNLNECKCNKCNYVQSEEKKGRVICG